jgi:hypothetical protein
MCNQVVRPLLGRGAGGRSPGYLLKRTDAPGRAGRDHLQDSSQRRRLERDRQHLYGRLRQWAQRLCVRLQQPGGRRDLHAGDRRARLALHRSLPGTVSAAVGNRPSLASLPLIPRSWELRVLSLPRDYPTPIAGAPWRSETATERCHEKEELRTETRRWISERMNTARSAVKIAAVEPSGLAARSGREPTALTSKSGRAW